MRCVLCRAFARLGTKVFADSRIFQIDRVRDMLQSWRYSQTSDAENYQYDPELDAVRIAERLVGDDPQASFSQFRALAERGPARNMFRPG